MIQPFGDPRGYSAAKSEKESTVNEASKEHLKDLGDHTLHGVEDAADVIGHGLGGAVKGVADGVESVSATTQERKDPSGEHEEE
jgi:hypothetical protein